MGAPCSVLPVALSADGAELEDEDDMVHVAAVAPAPAQPPVAAHKGQAPATAQVHKASKPRWPFSKSKKQSKEQLVDDEVLVGQSVAGAAASKHVAVSGENKVYEGQHGNITTISEADEELAARGLSLWGRLKGFKKKREKFNVKIQC